MARTIVLPNIFFEEVANQLREGNEVTVTVQGDSMYPFLHSGDTIQLRPYRGEELPLYCAVFYCWKGHYMTHRLICQEGDQLTMFGDGNIYQREIILREAVVGVLVDCQLPSGRHIDCFTEQWFIKGRIWYNLLFFRKVLIKLLKIIRY